MCFDNEKALKSVFVLILLTVTVPIGCYLVLEGYLSENTLLSSENSQLSSGIITASIFALLLIVYCWYIQIENEKFEKVKLEVESEKKEDSSNKKEKQT